MTQDFVTEPSPDQRPDQLPPQPTDPLAEAIRLHSSGALDAARDIYKSVLSRTPQDTRALHGLALIAIDGGVPDRALPFLMTCLQLAPGDALYRTTLGLALAKQGKLHEAAAQLLNAANRAPHLAEPRIHLAKTLGRMNRRAEGLRILEDATRMFPDRADVWVAKGQEERAHQTPSAAEISLRRALKIAPGDARVLNDLGVVVRAQGRTQDAAAIYREALALAPGDPLSHGNLGNALTELKDFDAAEEHLREAVAQAPGSAMHRCNLAIFLTARDRPHEASVLFKDVLMRQPDSADAWTNLGVAQLDMGEVADAETSLHKAIALEPQNAEAHYNLAWVLLLTGQWHEGWAEYEWRWRMPHFSSKRRTFSAPLWDGAAIDGTLFLHAEQGLGDAIQCVRFARAAKNRCKRVVLECPAPLVRLFQNLDGVDEVIAAGAALPAMDAHVPLMTLPRLLGTTPDTVPKSTYLHAPAETRTELNLPATQRRRIGLVWAGSPDNKIDRRRTIRAGLFAPLMEETAADFVSLQVGPKAEEVSDLYRNHLVMTCDGAVRDFADTAAVIAQLDLVIGVDTAAVHLAGALGVPVWVLLPKMPDYRWMLGREDTPWYPSMRLFRQTESGNWDEVMWRIRHALTLLQSSS